MHIILITIFAINSLCFIKFIIASIPKVSIAYVIILAPKNFPISLNKIDGINEKLLKTNNLFVIYAKSTAIINATVFDIVTTRLLFDIVFLSVISNILKTATFITVVKTPKNKYKNTSDKKIFSKMFLNIKHNPTYIDVQIKLITITIVCESENLANHGSNLRIAKIIMKPTAALHITKLT